MLLQWDKLSTSTTSGNTFSQTKDDRAFKFLFIIWDEILPMDIKIIVHLWLDSGNNWEKRGCEMLFNSFSSLIEIPPKIALN